MASLPITTMNLLFIFSLFPSFSLSQSTNSSVATVAQCATQLLPLATCEPFVQGTAPTPAQSCCNNLNVVYSQQPSCLCLLLNGTTLSSFPINTTLALQLPALCSLPVDASACQGGFSAGTQVPPSAPTSQVSLGANNNSTTTNSTMASSPVVQVSPRSTVMGLGLGGSASSSIKSKTGTYLAVPILTTVAGFLIPARVLF